MHLLCYLLSFDVDLNEAGREDGYGVEGVPDNCGTDSSRLKLAVVHDHEPFIRLGFNVEALPVFEQF